MTWFELRTTVDDARKDEASAHLWALGAGGVQEDHPGMHFDDGEGPVVAGGDWTPPPPVNPGDTVTLVAWFEDPEDPQALRAHAAEELRDLGAASVSIAPVVEQDWSATWKAGWTTQRLSERVWIVPSWECAPDLPPGEVLLRLDPGQAFGTGTHSTTRGCTILAERWLVDRPGARVLDVGTGTGILALAALRLGAATAVGVDPEAAAVEAAQANALANGLDAAFEVRAGTLDAAEGTWDLVFANILAPILIDVAAALVDRLEPGGTLVVSGILKRQGEDVLQAMEAAGLAQVDRIESEEWVSMRLERA